LLDDCRSPEASPDPVVWACDGVRPAWLREVLSYVSAWNFRAAFSGFSVPCGAACPGHPRCRTRSPGDHPLRPRIARNRAPALTNCPFDRRERANHQHRSLTPLTAANSRRTLRSLRHSRPFSLSPSTRCYAPIPVPIACHTYSELDSPADAHLNQTSSLSTPTECIAQPFHLDISIIHQQFSTDGSRPLFVTASMRAHHLPGLRVFLRRARPALQRDRCHLLVATCHCVHERGADEAWQADPVGLGIVFNARQRNCPQHRNAPTKVL
jgi:hypothetical protein